MTFTPKWWNANGPPSPTTPMSQLEQQFHEDTTTKSMIKMNRFHPLDLEDEKFMYKHALNDGTFVYSPHPTIKKLKKVLKTTNKLPQQNKFTAKISSLNETFRTQKSSMSHNNNFHGDDFITVTKKRGNNTSPSRTKFCNKFSSSQPYQVHLIKLTSPQFTLPKLNKSKTSIMSQATLRKRPLLPKLVPRTLSALPEWRDDYPATKSIKDFFDANPIEQLDLPTARKLYDRCVKHSFGTFVPGHHPESMDLPQLIPKLKYAQARIEEELPKDLERSKRIKNRIERIKKARSHLPARLCIHKNFPINYIIGLTKEQMLAMLHNHYVSNKTDPPEYRKCKSDLMCEVRYEILVLKQTAGELN